VDRKRLANALQLSECDGLVMKRNVKSWALAERTIERG